MNKTIFFCIILLFGSFFYAYSQVSIEECYEAARNNYPQIKKADLINKTKEYNITNANMGYVPKIFFSANAQYQSDVTKIPFSIPGIDIPVLDNDQYRISVDIQQPLWDGGKIEAEKERIKAQSESDESALEVQLYSLKYRINQLYFSILLLNEQLVQNELYTQDLKRTYDMVKGSINYGAANTADLDSVSLEQIKTKQNKAQLEAVKSSYITALEILTGMQLAEKELIKPEYVEITDFTNNRPELNMYMNNINLLETGKSSITASYMPTCDLFFSAGYGRPGFDMFKTDFQPFYVAGIKMSWTPAGLYTGERTKKIIELNKKSAELEKATFIFNTNIDIENQKAKIKRIKEAMEYDNDILKLRNNIRKSSEVKMKEGTMTVNDYMKDVTAENLAKQSIILHEIELIQAVYEMKSIINQ